MKRIAGVAVLAATLGSAHAAAQFDDYSIMGNGAISCSEFARYYRTDAAPPNTSSLRGRKAS